MALNCTAPVRVLDPGMRGLHDVSVLGWGISGGSRRVLCKNSLACFLVLIELDGVLVGAQICCFSDLKSLKCSGRTHLFLVIKPLFHLGALALATWFHRIVLLMVLQ